MVLALPSVRGWLSSCPDIDVDIIIAAVLSHHLQASDSNASGIKWGSPRTTQPSIQLFLDHPEVRRIFLRVQDIANLPDPPPLPQENWSAGSVWVKEVMPAALRRARVFGRNLYREPERQKLLLAVKAGVIVADSVASGIFRVGGNLSIEQWIEDVAHAPAIGGDEISSKILTPRSDQIAKRDGSFTLHHFQTLAAAQGPRALLIAGCGMGKTLAAWMWAEAQVRKRSVGRVLFLYPTRGTATEGFRDYVAWAPEADAALVHGSSKYELEAIFQNPPDSLQGKDPRLDEQSARLYALGLWSKRFFSATVDQFLGFMEHVYGSMCLLPVLADSVVIFDEVHCYDRRMFADLLSFLSHFDVPVLCMTATLPPDRRDQLVRAGLQVFPDEGHRKELADLEALETRPRYRVMRVEDALGALNSAAAAFRAGKRVLWVVNTVVRCQEIADLLALELGEEPLVYHSRFRLCDRQDAHARTVAAFGAGRGRAIAVTTQVCEMSLDLDADVLITELAPVTSLVQRFGRANRSPKRPASDRAEVLWYRPPSAPPYTSEDLASAEGFLRALGESETSQRRLTEALDEYAPLGVEMEETSRFLEGGYFATSGSLREGVDTTIPAILDVDFPQVSALLCAKQPVDGFVVPVPNNCASDKDSTGHRPAGLPRHLRVANGQYYSKMRGFIAPK